MSANSNGDNSVKVPCEPQQAKSRDWRISMAVPDYAQTAAALRAAEGRLRRRESHRSGTFLPPESHCHRRRVDQRTCCRSRASGTPAYDCLRRLLRSQSMFPSYATPDGRPSPSSLVPAGRHPSWKNGNEFGVNTIFYDSISLRKFEKYFKYVQFFRVHLGYVFKDGNTTLLQIWWVVFKTNQIFIKFQQIVNGSNLYNIYIYII